MRFSPGIAAAIMARLAAVPFATSILPYDARAAASDFTQSDATRTKAEVLKHIPIGTPAAEAKDRVTGSGFRCVAMRHQAYADYANPSNVQIIRRPADILYCDSGERSNWLLLVSRRWQVGFEATKGKVSYVAVGVGLTGP